MMEKMNIKRTYPRKDRKICYTSRLGRDDNDESGIFIPFHYIPN